MCVCVCVYIYLNIGVQIPFELVVLFSLDIYPEMELVKKKMVSLFLASLRNFILF